MLSKILYVAYTVFMLWWLVMLLLILNSNITFGAGLGDIAFLFLLVVIGICISIAFVLRLLKRLTNAKVDVVIIPLMLLTVLYFTLKFTILRDGEYKWNGKIFYHQPF